MVLVGVLGVFTVAGVWLATHMTPSSDTGMWRTDFTKASVSMSEIMEMGGRDSIQPIDMPRFVRASEVTWLGGKSPVIAVTTPTLAKAYPLAVLMQHLVVNDLLGTHPIAVTFCPLCNSPMVFSRQVGDETLRFSASGTIRNNGFIMWDEQTESWWQQFTGVAIVGAYSGTQLQPIASQVVGWSVFKERYPNGYVLEGEQDKQYGRNPYIGYDSNPQPMLYVPANDTRLFATERVLAGVVAGVPMAYPFSLLSKRAVLNDTIENMAVVAFWQKGAASAQDNVSIDQSRDVGMAVLFSRQLGEMRLTFRYEMDGTFRDNETNSTWNIFGECVAGDLRGSMLATLPAYPYFWFAWSTTYPETHLYGG